MGSGFEKTVYALQTTTALFLLAFLIVSAHHVYLRLFSRHSLPESLPWVGVDGNFFSRARANVRTFLHTRDLVQEGYYKYSKNNLPFVLPNATTGPEVILPMSHMKWLQEQPDNVLSQNEVNRQFLQADYTMLHPKIIHDTVHEDVIKKELTRYLGNFTEDVQEEIDYAFRKAWGVNTKDWVEISPYTTMLEIIARVSNRILVGLPLCRDERYIGHSSKFARLVVVQATFLSQVPDLFKFIVAPIVNGLDTLRYRKCAKYIIPIINQRNSASPKGEKENDYIQWCIDHSYRNNDPSLRNPDLISKRLSVLQFAGIQSSAITLTNLILDLGASPLISKYLSIMREEVRSELGAENGVWSKAALARMVTLDSAARESLRLWAFVSRGVMKQVVKKDGINLPTGEHLPFGTNVGIHNYPVHHDEDYYQNPYSFDPLRFCSPIEPANQYEKKSAQSVRYKGTPLVTTTPKYLAFSHGKHSCPGRFFASQQLKLVLAYIATNYDIQHIDLRPENNWLVGSQGPPLNVQVRIRRREETV
ncbi:hypothetical protein BUE80_DR001381 [Diplocarpon rosae]|nr:hypothetical protein BUE80_DR001381 [Diplocarpon rosae]